MHYTNCHRTNYNVETYRVKRKEDYVPKVYEVTILNRLKYRGL
jgi:hypothetical protein